MLATGAARAQDATGEGASGALVPIGDAQVEIINARIKLGESGKVWASYTFWNPGAKDIDLDVGIPVMDAAGQSPIESLSVSVGGAKTMPVSQPGCDGATGMCVDRMLVFHATFPSHSNVTITTSYSQKPALSAGGSTTLAFMLSAASMWKGMLGNLKLEVKAGHPVCQPLGVGSWTAPAPGDDAPGADPGFGGLVLAGLGNEPRLIDARKGEVTLPGCQTTLRYQVTGTKDEVKLLLAGQDIEPGDILVTVPPFCAWDLALVIDPLESACDFLAMSQAKDKDLAAMAGSWDEDRARLCKALPDFLLDGGAVFTTKTFGGIEAGAIAQALGDDMPASIPLYMKSGLVPGLEGFRKAVAKMLAMVA